VKGDVESLLWPEVARFVAAAHPALHPGRSAAIELAGRRIGWIGELHPRWRQAYELPGNVVVCEIDAEPLMQRPLPSFAELPKQQSAWRDIAVVAKRDVGHAALMAAIDDAGESAVRGATLFDIFEPKAGAAGIGAGERSLAVRLELRDDNRTLTDEQIDRIVASIVESLRQRLGARLRQQ
jgi:phenylalanyl-tRNA synthetase beta chain